MMKQSDAVVGICQQYCADKGYEFGGDLKVIFNKEDLDTISMIIAQGFDENKIDMSSSARSRYDSVEKLKVYSRGLLNDRLRKHKGLNGGVSYEAKEPGKFAGSRDPQLKALQQLLKVQPENADSIQPHINRRVAEIAAEKASKIEIDFSVLPAELQELLGK